MGTQSSSHIRLCAAAAATALLAACGGGGSPGAPGAARLSPEAAQFIDIDPAALPDYGTTLPAHYAGALAQDNTPPGTVPSDAVATLGRVMFHDRQLSRTGTVSCASCHDATVDFGDSKRFSTGFDGIGQTTAHAMRLANVRFFKAGTMFWDKRAPSLESQALMPVQHPVEMGFDESHGGLAAVMARMRELPYYPELFTGAFGDAAIDEARMQLALAQYMRAMVSVNSRWDEAFAQVFDPALPDTGVNLPLPGFTAQEERGRHLFMAPRAEGGQACAACHVPPSFALGGSGSNGLDAGESVRFKSPSLKNVARSGAFMHDGRFATLEQVVEHYDSGVQDGPALDNRLRGADGAPLRPNLPQEDKDALVAFLKTLTDPVLARDPRFTSPFHADKAAGP